MKASGASPLTLNPDPRREAASVVGAGVLLRQLFEIEHPNRADGTFKGAFGAKTADGRVFITIDGGPDASLSNGFGKR